MSIVRVKICGIRRGEDARAAVEAGADALGFVFARSPRQVLPEKAKEIISSLPPFIAAVGVFVNDDPERIRRIGEFCPLDYVQLHGDEGPDYCAEFGDRAIKAVRVRDSASLSGLGKYRVAAFLLDGASGDERGGTGTAFRWELAAESGVLGRPVILAGGLTAENVREAIERVKPYAVDVSSGVESEPGKKDPALVREFIRKAKGNS